jgi:hypothetical protein
LRMQKVGRSGGSRSGVTTARPCAQSGGSCQRPRMAVLPLPAADPTQVPARTAWGPQVCCWAKGWRSSALPAQPRSSHRCLRACRAGLVGLWGCLGSRDGMVVCMHVWCGSGRVGVGWGGTAYAQHAPYAPTGCAQSSLPCLRRLI